VRIISGHPHNEYLEVAAEYGLIGFGLLALAWLYGLIKLFVFSLKTPNQHHAFMAMAFLGTAAGTMLHSFFDFQMHVHPNAMVFAFLAAVAAGPMFHMTNRRPGEFVSRGSCLVLAILYLAGTAFCLPVMSSAAIRALGNVKAAQKKETQAEKCYHLAIRLDKANWRAYFGLGELWFIKRHYTIDPEEKREFAQQERAWYEKAYALNARDPRVMFGLGRVLIFTGDKERGIEILKKLADYKRFNDYYQWYLGVELRRAGRYEEALAAFKRAKELKNTPSVRRNIEWLEIRMGLRPPKRPKDAAKSPPVKKESPENDSDVLLLETLLDMMIQE